MPTVSKGSSSPLYLGRIKVGILTHSRFSGFWRDLKPYVTTCFRGNPRGSPDPTHYKYIYTSNGPNKRSATIVWRTRISYHLAAASRIYLTPNYGNTSAPAAPFSTSSLGYYLLGSNKLCSRSSWWYRRQPFQGNTDFPGREWRK
jgi:hypothetical protein